MNYLKARIEKPVTFISCGHFISGPGWIHSRRIIDSFEVIIGLKGTVYIEENGSKYAVEPGSVLLLSPEKEHNGFQHSDEDVSFYWMHFHIKDQFAFLDSKEAFSEITPLQTDPYINLLSESIMIPISSKLEGREKVSILMRQLLHISTSKYYTPYAAGYLLTSILIEISQQSNNSIFNDAKSRSFNNSKFAEVLEWIRTNINRDITAIELAEKFNFNKDYLTRIFKKNFGVGIVKYINGMKISKAKELLYHTNKDIKEIAYYLGFSDEKYFMKLFKEYENITPTEFRNAYYKTHINII